MIKLLILLFLSIRAVFCTNSVLFGPGFPSKFACSSDAYGLEALKYQIPKEISDRFVNVNLEVSRHIEIPEEIGIERELVESGLTLYDESKVIKVGLVYPSIEYKLQRYLAKEYVQTQMVVASLNSLRTLTYIINTLKSFAKLNMNKYSSKTTDEAKFGICSAIVYADIADKLEVHRAKQLQRIKEENKRITFNISQLGRVKSTGNMWLLTSGAYFAAAFYTLLLLSFATFYHLF